MKLHKIASTDDLIPQLSHICIDKDNVVATNAHVLVIVPKALFFGEEKIPEMFVRGRDWAKIYPRNNHYLKYEEGHLILYARTKCYSGEVARIKPILKEKAHFNYPEYMKIIPTGEAEKIDKIGLSSYLMRLYNEATGITNVKLSFYGYGKAIVLTPLDYEYRDVKAIIMPVMLPEYMK